MRVAHFCPICGAATALQLSHGKMRPVCTSCGQTVFFEPRVAVVIFAVEAGRVLLVQRANDPAKGTWALPAGFVDPDEDPAHAAQRELWEETGLVADSTRLLDVLHRPDQNGLADIVLIYAAHLAGGVLKAGDDAAAAGWYPLDALPTIGFRTTEIVLERWRSGSWHPD